MVEGNGLENRHTGNGIEGSNPSLSEFTKTAQLCWAVFVNGAVFAVRKLWECEAFVPETGLGYH